MLAKLFNRENFPFGVLIGCAIGGLFVSFIEWPLSEAIRGYATFAIGIVVALLTSSFAIAGLLFRMERERSQALLAARATLPARLSELYAMSLEGAQLALDVKEHRTENDHSRKARLDALALSKDMTGELKEVIKYADKATASWLSLILAHWQINLSRLSGQLNDRNMTIPEHQPGYRATDWMLMYNMISHLFNFARTGTQPNDELPSPFRFEMDFYLDNYSKKAHLDEAVRKYEERYQLPRALSYLELQSALLSE